MTINECIDDYIAKNQDYLKERTIYGYNTKKKQYAKMFGDVDISTFTQEYVQGYITKAQKQGTPKKTLQSNLALLFLVLRPYVQYQPFRYIVVEKDKEEKKVYSESDVKKIADYIVVHPRRLYTPILIAIYTGMRLSEITGLKWGDVDFAEKTITVKRNAAKVGGKEFVSTPKTKGGLRTIYMPDVLYEYLKAQKMGMEQGSYICTGTNDVQPMRSVQRSNELLCKKLSIKNCGMHAYRHAFASALLKTSTDFKTIAEVMGHSTITVTQNIYNHTTQERKNEVVAKAFGEKPTEQQCDYQAQINALQSQINNLCLMVGKMAQYIQDNTVQKKGKKGQEPQTMPCVEEKTLPITAQKKPNIQQIQDNGNDLRPPKFKVTDGYGNDKLFYSESELLENLDISKAELKKHLNGQYTILDDLEIIVVKI